MSGVERTHPVVLRVKSDGGGLSTIPNPAAFGDEGGPEWIMRYGNPIAHRYQIADVIATMTYLISPEYRAQDQIRRLRELRKAFAAALQRAKEGA